MNRSAPLLCFFVLTGGAALGVGTPIDQGPLMAKLHATAAVVKRSGLERPAPDVEVAVRSFWQEALAYTRTNSGSDLDTVRWAIPFRTAHEWMLTCVCRGRAQAESLTREALAVLRESKPKSPAIAAELAGDIALAYAYAWMKSDLPACVRLVDETAAWVASTGDKSATQAFFVKRMFFDGNCLLCQFQLPESERKEFCAKRWKRLVQYLDNKDLKLRYRTLALSHWAECLLRLGRSEEADICVRDWWQKHQGRIAEAMYFEVLMEIALDVQGDWVLARRVLDTANKMSGRWVRTYEAKVNENIGALYYDNIQFPGYELKRSGAMKQQENERKLRALGAAAAIRH